MLYSANISDRSDLSEIEEIMELPCEYASGIEEQKKKKHKEKENQKQRKRFYKTIQQIISELDIIKDVDEYFPLTHLTEISKLDIIKDTDGSPLIPLKEIRKLKRQSLKEIIDHYLFMKKYPKDKLCLYFPNSKDEIKRCYDENGNLNKTKDIMKILQKAIYQELCSYLGDLNGIENGSIKEFIANNKCWNLENKFYLNDNDSIKIEQDKYGYYIKFSYYNAKSRSSKDLEYHISDFGKSMEYSEGKIGAKDEYKVSIDCPEEKKQIGFYHNNLNEPLLSIKGGNTVRLYFNSSIYEFNMENKTEELQAISEELTCRKISSKDKKDKTIKQFITNLEKNLTLIKEQNIDIRELSNNEILSVIKDSTLNKSINAQDIKEKYDYNVKKANNKSIINLNHSNSRIRDWCYSCSHF